MGGRQSWRTTLRRALWTRKPPWSSMQPSFLNLLLLVMLFLIDGLSHWGYHSYGYGPSSIAAVLGIACIVLLLTAASEGD